MKRVGDGLAAWLLVGAIGWVGIVAIGWMLWQSNPPRAGFDLALLLEAARRVSAGQSPYDPAMLAGTAPDATSLFYSYPPPVAQAMSLLAWLPDGIVLAVWGLGSAIGLGVVAYRLALRAGRISPQRDALKTIAASSLVLPFGVAVLFGNLDAWYALAFGALVLAVSPRMASQRTAIIGGIALGVVAAAKLHPASLIVWLLARVIATRTAPERTVLVTTLLTGVGIVLLSVLVGGVGPWQDYLTVLRVGSGADLVDPRNASPVSLVGQMFGLDASALRVVQVAVTLGALAATLISGVRVRDSLSSVGVAIAASLVVLPVTWYHYPVALIPVGVALALRVPSTRLRLALAVVVVDLAVAFIPLLWLAVAVLVLAAITAGRGERTSPSLRVVA